MMSKYAKKCPPVFYSIALRYFLLFIVFALPLKSFNQQIQQVDVVYLNNGSILRGEIIEIIPDSLIKVRIAGGSLLVYAWEEVKKIVKEEVVIEGKAPTTYSVNPQDSGKISENYYQPRRRKVRNNPRFQKEWSYTNITETGFLLGQGYAGGTALFVQTINGYQLWPHLSIGGGIGFDRYLNEGTFMPLFLDVRGYLLKNKKVNPFSFVDIGYSVSFFNVRDVNIEHHGGLVFHHGYGITLATRNKFAWIFSLGYKLQKMSKIFEEEVWGGIGGSQIHTVSLKATMHRISMNFGVQF